MRKLIIDTDTGSDDAVALAMALKAEIELLGITTVAGNCDLETATKNALMTVEKCGRHVPVYPGCSQPLFRRQRVDATAVHGKDGMGDCDLIHPTREASDLHAVDFLLQQVKRYPQEVEIALIGPATNVALAIMKEPAVMAQVKHFYIMGTAGFGPGNASPVAEFNVYADAESYVPLLNSPVPKTIIGFDVCIAHAFDQTMIEALAAASPLGKFLMQANQVLLAYNVKRTGEAIIDLPDAVALAVVLWPETVLAKKSVYAECCYQNESIYGQVIFHDRMDPLAVPQDYPADNATVVTAFDGELFKARTLALL